MESLLNQTYRDWELIVCDSYSEDGTWEYLSEFSSDPRTRLFQVPREGLYAGWNECLKRARGEFIYFATADDTMHPECLERLVQPLIQHEDVDLALTRVADIDESGEVLPVREPLIWRFLNKHAQGESAQRISGDAFFLLLAGFPWGFGSVTGLLFRRSLLEKTGLFPTHLSFLGDALWSLRACLSSDVILVPGCWATWRLHPEQASSRFDLRHSLIFYEALKEVVDSEQHRLPQHWLRVSRWKARLLKSREVEAVFATGLCRFEFSQNWRRFPERLIKLWRLDRRLCLGRVFSGFASPVSRQFSHTDLVESLLEVFKASWPGKAI